ncbi:membrane protein [Corynebacterium diphtheriae]|uniref:hypothetical protein n=1 Tax=Corynebacterium diphtheriae TaxID=1717 RepID=UPI000D05A71A|nr:hypothetical protein [Corynebacterium diphtheriae]PSA86699.1 hypothetical protein BT093_01275 [Corynebacterium diphtheriae]UWE74625.1 hypothetical protein NY043_07360 [Corynebacterium diphtheriae bv. gravis]UWE90200.1 hypothetical protein NY051_00580 [Corynebacterium diphtheriae bv. gravis]UWF06795.1 hypothetical protein NY042_09675 [Corynebacterium diphtheriae bv. gravis]UWF11511.1 hypothetical protein NY046_01300 [Corynebacterium diphtheriae bv. gravis]
MNIRSTKIVAALVAMALCTPNIAFAQETSNLTTISGSTDVNGDFSLTRSISAINRNDSTPPDSKTIYVNPGDTIHVQLDLKGKKANRTHGFTSFKEVVSPIQAFSASSGSLKYKKTSDPTLFAKQLDDIAPDTFKQTGDQTIEFKGNSPLGFGVTGNHVTIDYSYTAGNELGEYTTQFLPASEIDKERFNANDLSPLDLKVVIEEPKEPSLGKILGWLGGVLGILAVVGGGLWHLLRNLIRI